ARIAPKPTIGSANCIELKFSTRPAMVIGHSGGFRLKSKLMMYLHYLAFCCSRGDFNLTNLRDVRLALPTISRLGNYSYFSLVVCVAFSVGGQGWSGARSHG